MPLPVPPASLVRAPTSAPISAPTSNATAAAAATAVADAGAADAGADAGADGADNFQAYASEIGHLIMTGWGYLMSFCNIFMIQAAIVVGILSVCKKLTAVLSYR